MDGRKQSNISPECVSMGQTVNTNIFLSEGEMYPNVLTHWGRDKMDAISQTTFSMMTSSNGNIFRVTGPLCGEFTGPGEFPTQRPVTRSFDVYFDLRLNKRLSKQPWGWWFETPSWSLWRQRNAIAFSWMKMHEFL